MAAQLSAAQHFKFRLVQIIKDESLGIGSYGAVYRAKCDKLPCAAKLLHPILFQDRDPGSQRIRERFEQECQFLSGIRHPHIVQYLGTCTDTESGLPVLLMELMDENLTHLLERSRQPLPFHQEVNICHDTSLALDYLHSNGIIHRDLSSNNVLIAGSRAKVTDFGMSKAFEANPGITPFTHCPGTAVYMPPEGLRNPPVYTTKLDCFSFGVLGIQIMTRQFPNPGPEERVLEDARSPTGTIKVPNLDSERRKSHIDLITPSHPLLPLALHCLNYRDSDRPSAEELCDHLELLKGGPQYQQSQTQGLDEGQDLQVTAQVHQNEELDHVHQQHLQDKDAVIAAAQKREQLLREQEQQLRQELRERDQQLAEKARNLQETMLLFQEKDRLVAAKEQNLKPLVQASEAMVAGQQTLVQQENKADQNHEDLSSTNRERVAGVPRRYQMSNSTPADTIKLKWRTGTKAPAEMIRGTSAVSDDGSKVYFRCRNNMYEYNTRRHQWTKLPRCPDIGAGLVVVKGLLTTVGGRTDDWILKNNLFSLVLKKREQTWTQHYPPMPTKRWCPAVVCNGNSLVVAGGHGDDTTVAVEVMDTSSLLWFVTASLPHYFNIASATLCGDSLYLMGGFNKAGTMEGSRSVLTCSLTTLLAFRRSQSLPPRMEAVSTAEQSQVWKKAADAPVNFTSCANLCGQVIAVGGKRNTTDPTDNVYQYDPAKNTWCVVSHMPTPRYRCLIETLSDNSILVVGGVVGYGSKCDIVEIGSVVRV